MRCGKHTIGPLLFQFRTGSARHLQESGAMHRTFTIPVYCKLIVCSLMILSIGCQQQSTLDQTAADNSNAAVADNAEHESDEGANTTAQQSLDPILTTMINAANSSRATMLERADGVLSDYKAYQDGEKNGMVTEYVLSNGADVDHADLSSTVLKANMINTFGADPKSKILFE